jgi:hypothetical protein
METDDIDLVLQTTMMCWMGYWVVLPFCMTYMTPTARKKGDSFVDASEIVAMIHNLFCVSMVTWYRFNPSPTGEIWVLSIALGYFIWDFLICCVFPRRMGFDMFVHATICCVGYTIALKPFMAHEALALLQFEWSSPFLHMNRLAQSQNWGIKLQFYSSLVFALLFFAIRVVWGSFYILTHVIPLIIEFYQKGDLMPGMTAAAVVASMGSVVLNLNWFRQMTRSRK